MCNDLKFVQIGRLRIPSVRAYIVKDLNNLNIGSASGINIRGTFSCVIKINKEYQKCGIGFMSFMKLFNELNNYRPIIRFEANWKMDNDKDGVSTNLIEFQKNKDVFDTPTGKWMKKIEFNAHNITFLDDNRMTIIFTK